MHDTHHEHESEKSPGTFSDITKLRKMAEHWISHNEEHARSYLLWADRAKAAGLDGPSAILGQLAGEVLEQNERFEEIIRMIGSDPEKSKDD
ncbi:MAG: hypothetical protein AB9866_22620 [Syntrophobacteraceae bacterium]